MTTITYPSGVIAPVPPLPVRRWTVEEYHEMIRSGVLKSGDPYELLEGWIVPKMSRNSPHEVALVLVCEALRAVLPAGWHIRVQSAITTGDSEPEPDVVVVRGAARDYQAAHPGPGDIGLLVEISDSSLTLDRGTKQRIYAQASIGEYWLVNLVDRQIEVRSQPDALASEPKYGQCTEYGSGDSIPFSLDDVQVDSLLVSSLLP